jgi:hypothetical protein
MSRHPFKWLTYHGQKIRIDREIAPLISMLWELEIGTISCCQASCPYSRSCGHSLNKKTSNKIKTKLCNNHVWLVFDNARSLEQFYNYVAIYEEDYPGKPVGMQEHIRGYTLGSHPEAWEMFAWTENRGVVCREERIPIPKEERKYWPKGRKSMWIAVDDHCDQNDFRLMPQLWFPRAHLAYVEDRLRQALTK